MPLTGFVLLLQVEDNLLKQISLVISARIPFLSAQRSKEVLVTVVGPILFLQFINESLHLSVYIDSPLCYLVITDKDMKFKHLFIVLFRRATREALVYPGKTSCLNFTFIMYLCYGRWSQLQLSGDCNCTGRISSGVASDVVLLPIIVCSYRIW